MSGVVLWDPAAPPGPFDCGSRTVRRFLLRFFAIIGVLVTVGLAALVLVTFLFVAPEPVPRAAVLEVDLEPGLVEHVPDDPILLTLERRRLTVRGVVDGLHRAADDDRVRGLLVRVGDGALGLGVVEELREGVLRFRESGKPAILFSESFGEFGPGHGGYYLATAFDEIVLQPSGDLGLTGLSAEAPFFRGTLDRMGVEPQVSQREAYKTAAEAFTEDGFTEASREATRGVLEAVFAELVSAVADARAMGEEQVRTILDSGPFWGEEAVAAGLVDRLAYRDEVMDDLRARLGEEVELVSFRRYRNRAGSAWGSGATVALIHGSGTVTRGESGFDPVFGGSSVGSETVARAFRQAVDDPSVEAILFRVDSPGGSYVASDVIHREVRRARDQGKPVVVTMGNVAASGGYLVAAGADRIVAHPSTITGSIGVVAGKAVTNEMWGKVGVSWDVVEVGSRTAMWSPVRPFGDAEWERVEAGLDRIYDEFQAKVAEGRGMSREEVHEVAQGRIWTGRQARDLGLVDHLGGFTTALEVVREVAGIDPDRAVELTVFPPERSLFQVLLDEGRFDRAGAGEEVLVSAVEAVRPFQRALMRAGALPLPGPVTAPELLDLPW